MKKNKQYYKEKKIIKLKMEGNDISDAIRNQGYIELDKPIHDGYYSEWLLRPDISRRDDAFVYQEALDACKKKLWCKNKDFKFKDYKTKKMVHHNPGMISINKAKYDALSVRAQKFYVEDISKKNWRYNQTDKHYRCTLSFELIVNIKKAYITHRREHDNILYQLDAENEKMLYLAANGHPWTGDNGAKWWRKLENKRIKLAEERKIKEIKKVYKGRSSKNDLLDIE